MVGNQLAIYSAGHDSALPDVAPMLEGWRVPLFNKCSLCRNSLPRLKDLFIRLKITLRVNDEEFLFLSVNQKFF